jgi:hypothetical protein
LQVSAAYPQKIKDPVLLLEIKINSGKKHVQAVVAWNGRDIARIGAAGHHFVRVPRELFRGTGNSVSLHGLAADSTVAMLEIKNLYGFSTGLLRSAMVIPHSPSVQTLPRPLAALLAAMLLLLAAFFPKTSSLASGNRWLRLGAGAVTIFFLAVLAAPLFLPIRIFLGLGTVMVLLSVLYWPGLWLSLRSLTGFFRSRVYLWIRLKLPPLVFIPRHRKLLGALALAGLFVFFSAHRQRYVGAADWYGYHIW